MSEAQRVEAALASAKIDEAVRVSGEATATADAEWTRLFNAHDSSCEDALVAANFIAGRHLVALLQANVSVEAYSTAAMLLYRSTLVKDNSASLAQSLLDILCSMLQAALNIGEMRGYMSVGGEGDAPDGEAVGHYAHVLSYVASMLYAYYQKVGETRPDTPLLEDAYALLSQMQEIGAIQSPEVNVAGKDVAAYDIAGILPDLLGRSKAIGMIDVE